MQIITDPELQRLIVKNSPDLIYVVDFEERFIFVSSSVKTMFGYEPEELLGRKILNFIMPKSYEKQALALEKVMKEKRYDSSDRLELEVFKKDGGKTWVEAHAKFLLSDSGEPLAIIGIARELDKMISYE